MSSGIQTQNLAVQAVNIFLLIYFTCNIVSYVYTWISWFKLLFLVAIDVTSIELLGEF